MVRPSISSRRLANPLRQAWQRTKSLAHSDPDFFIIGTQKGGTTSLYQYLAQHPQVIPASKKEIQFFTDNYQKGCSWYKRHFPSFAAKYNRRLLGHPENLTGEATPYYIFHPHAPRRIRETYPNAKIIIMLRNPIDRAYSHYRYHAKLGEEALSFEEAIKAEPKRLEGELEKMQEDENYTSYNYKVYSYLARGVYIDQVKRWFSLFPRDQMLVIASEEFFREPQACFGKVLKFLDLPKCSLPAYDKYNAGDGDSLDPETRKRLMAYFKLYNERLFAYLGIDFEWDG